MSGKESSPNADQEQLDAIAEEFARACRAGEQPDIDAFTAQCGAPEQQVRELLESIQLLEQFKSDRNGVLSSGGASATNSLADALDKIDDYTIVREIGRGGMGLVFEAIQQSLGRRVAIKILSSSNLKDGKRLQRFRIEARAAARLRHPHIVPVFGVGNQGDTHYYVMDFIAGDSLRDYIDAKRETHRSSPSSLRGSSVRKDAPTVGAAQTTRASSDMDDSLDSRTEPTLAVDSKASSLNTNWVANLGATVSAALAYAHDQGVLHRDIKPSNLLLDDKGQVWIADFGLAKLAEYDDLTKTGDVIGTPQYMPPESFRGVYDHRSEVYAVGLTLYELLTLQPAIAGQSAAEIIRNASEGQIQSLRKRLPNVPRDLETIVLKCLQCDPALRYQSAQLLSDDLQKFCDGLPVSARRIGSAQRLVRWARREPLVASLTLVSFVSLAGLAGVSVVGYWKANRSLASTNAAWQTAEMALLQRTAALRQASEQQTRAEANLQVALRAFGDIMHNVSRQSMETDAEILGEVTDTTVVGVTDADAALLQSLLGFFDELAENNSAHLIAESAFAARAAADIYVSLGQLEKASLAYGDALDRFERARQHADSDELQLQNADLLNQMAVVESLRGRVAGATDCFENAVQILESSPNLLDLAEGKFQYARAHRLFASTVARSGLEIQSRPGPPNLSPRGQRSFSFLPGRGSNVLRMRNRRDVENASIAVEKLTELVDEFPMEARYRSELAHAYRNQAEVLLRDRQRPEAEAAIEKAVTSLEELLRDNPGSQAVRYELASTLVSAKILGFNQMYRAVRAHELTVALLAQNPDLPRYQALRARSLENLALLEQRTGKASTAKRYLEDAARIYGVLHDRSPEISIYALRLAGCYESLSDLAHHEHDRASEISNLQLAIELLQATDLSSAVGLESQRLQRKLRRINSPPGPQR